ncbi:unnamed protein product [Thlaspi arvense]|uniref:Uncharacterized protein n=1 Tax=Thlaspi arvense TaxID=13288 RepID=A0AAU9S7G4_THLAR|nr:unnamed protein product [Thlaspi arvense]
MYTAMVILLRFVLVLQVIAFSHSEYIQSSHGNLVECVDKMTQRAFDNELLRNHKFQYEEEIYTSSNSSTITPVHEFITESLANSVKKAMLESNKISFI